MGGKQIKEVPTVIKQEESTPVSFLTSYIRLENKKNPRDRICLGFYSKQIPWIMTNLKIVLMSKNHHGPGNRALPGDMA